MPAKKPNDQEFRAGALAALKVHADNIIELKEGQKELARAIQSNRDDITKITFKLENISESVKSLDTRIVTLAGIVSAGENARSASERTQIVLNTKASLLWVIVAAIGMSIIGFVFQYILKTQVHAG